jgi:hypothetical protein
MNMEYDVTEATDDYFMLNGRSFPYTIRESLIYMEENQKVKLRVFDGHADSLALHIHGHKPTITHYDGVDNGPGSYIQRDVFSMIHAQRLDLELSGVDDGLHSFGQGIWMFHDHIEKAFTTNGIGEGGDISLVVYKGFLDEKGIPISHGMSLAPYFTKGFWQGKYPIWQDYDAWRSLGLPDLKAGYEPAKIAVQKAKVALSPGASASQQDSIAGKFFYGLLLGLFSYLAIIKRKLIFALARQLRGKANSLLSNR